MSLAHGLSGFDSTVPGEGPAQVKCIENTRLEPSAVRSTAPNTTPSPPSDCTRPYDVSPFEEGEGGREREMLYNSTPVKANCEHFQVWSGVLVGCFCDVVIARLLAFLLLHLLLLTPPSMVTSSRADRNLGQ